MYSIILQRSWNHKLNHPQSSQTWPRDTDPSHECKLFLSRAMPGQNPNPALRRVHGIGSPDWNQIFGWWENFQLQTVFGFLVKIRSEIFPAICSTGGSGQKAEGTTPSRSTLLEGVRGWSGYHWESLEKMQWGCAGLWRSGCWYIFIIFYWSLFVDS